MKTADLRAGTVYVMARRGLNALVVLSTDTFQQFSSSGQYRGSILRVPTNRVEDKTVLRGVLTAQIIIDRDTRFESPEDEAKALVEVAANVDAATDEWTDSAGSPASKVQQVTLDDDRVVSFRISVRSAREIGMPLAEYTAERERKREAERKQYAAADAKKVQAAADLAETKALFRVTETEDRAFRAEPGGRVSITASDLLALTRRITG